MSRQSEIREGIARRLWGLAVYEDKEWEELNEIAKEYWLTIAKTYILNYLDSEGAVLKVEKDNIEFKVKEIEIDGCKLKVIVPEGYVFVEPLIEVKDE